MESQNPKPQRKLERYLLLEFVGKFSANSFLELKSRPHFFRASVGLTRVITTNGATGRLSRYFQSLPNARLVWISMFARFSHRYWTIVAAPLFVVCCTGSVHAGWMTIKNDTNKTIVVQEIVDVNGQVKRGKPTNLLPGETLREYLPEPSVKKIELFEAQDSKKAVWSGNLSCKDDMQTFSVTCMNGKVNVGQVTCPPKK